MQPNEKSEIRPFANFPNGLIVTPWGDGVMIGIVDQNTRQGISSYLGSDGLVRLFSWLIASGIVRGEIQQETPSNVMVEWPGPNPDAG